MGQSGQNQPVLSEVSGGFPLAMNISEITCAHLLFSFPQALVLETGGTSGCLKDLGSTPSPLIPGKG